MSAIDTTTISGMGCARALMRIGYLYIGRADGQHLLERGGLRIVAIPDVPELAEHDLLEVLGATRLSLSQLRALRAHDGDPANDPLVPPVRGRAAAARELAMLRRCTSAGWG